MIGVGHRQASDVSAAVRGRSRIVRLTNEDPPEARVKTGPADRVTTKSSLVGARLLPMVAIRTGPPGPLPSPSPS
jgi:hypothetical protein